MHFRRRKFCAAAALRLRNTQQDALLVTHKRIKNFSFLLTIFLHTIFLYGIRALILVLWQPLHFYSLNKRSCLAKKTLVTSPIETSHKVSPPSKFSNWQRLFTRSTITVKVTRLLALQVCFPITRLLILLLRNHEFWIAEQPIILHLIHNFSHTLHHHLFQMLICP